ncbi:MAG: hypothetical protein H6730_13260 [Deltaproteobacteria bacterium]|nr:hypothetical protein [Deltaproteobacteria bacterium]
MQVRSSNPATSQTRLRSNADSLDGPLDDSIDSMDRLDAPSERTSPRPTLQDAEGGRQRAQNDPAATQLRQRLDEIERMQQQAAAEGMRFEDSNANGRVDDSDLVRLQDGRTQLFGEIDADVRERMMHRSMRVGVVQDYALRPVEERLGWSAGYEAANPAFWESDGDTWTLGEGQDPASAVSDLYENSGLYSTECAQARTSLEAYAELAHRRERDGDALGTLGFNRDFIASTDERAKMDDYIGQLSAVPRAARDAWAAENPPPEVSDYDLAINGHSLLTGGKALRYLNQTSGGAPGENGYFHNLGVSEEERRAGWVGENVIDLGEQGGLRQLWGHPGQVKSVDVWQAELGGRQVRSPGELAPRLSSVDGQTALSTDGRLGSRENLERWMKTSDFAEAYRRGTGRAYAGNGSADTLSVAELRAVVAAELPETARLKTSYGAVYSGVTDPSYAGRPQTLDWQLAFLLKEGRMPVQFGFDPGE